MRPWILLRHFDIEFEEIRIPLFVEGFQNKLRKYSPTLKVPVLRDDGLTVWDSLAICEYVSETHLQGRALPTTKKERANCRSYCSEMHSGFMAIRTQLPMNCRASRKLDLSDEVLAECARVDTLWTGARNDSQQKGDYLFGDFTIADCMYAPMAMRFHTYGVPLTDISQSYIKTLLHNDAIKQWREAAQQEAEMLDEYEIGHDLTD